MIPKFKRIEKRFVYSTEETFVGIMNDGSKIYRRVVQNTTANAINTAKTLTAIENLNYIINHSISWYVDGFKYVTSNPDEAPVVFIDNNNNIIESHKADYFNGVIILIILEYTKTTD